MSQAKSLTTEQSNELIATLNERFHQHMHRHQSMNWQAIQEKLEKAEDKRLSLYEMERTGGEPDVIDFDEANNEYLFVDCSLQSPKGRRSICYDREALASRKKHPPKNTAMDMAEQMGVQLLTEQEYRKLQTIGEFDTKTSSWILTPTMIRELGGALFGDRRYNHVFIYHNGAQSYYASRGFRGKLRV